MTSTFRYLTHPQVNQDPSVPVPEWGISPDGRNRLLRLKDTSELKNTGLVISSTETKATETAEVISNLLGITYVVRQNMHENNRTATGYLPPDEFEKTADDFFSKPLESTRGWERAIDAQKRIVGEFEATVSENPGYDVLYVGHGAVGTLLLCHLLNVPISRNYDQPSGGGNYYVGNLEARSVARVGHQ